MRGEQLAAVLLGLALLLVVYGPPVVLVASLRP